MLDHRISPLRLANYAPEILKECQAVLGWLEQKELTDTVAYLKLRTVVHLLQDAGVKPPLLECAPLEPVFPPDFDLTSLDSED